MIVGIGCDIVDHSTTEQLEWESDPKALQRIFSQPELNLYYKKRNLKFLAGRFAAKEAVLKCIGTGMRDGISLTDIQILPDHLEKPIIKLTGEVEKISDQMSINLWHVSITHSLNCSIAFVIAES
jgi:holo-[acyl-carrier protein] synthase